MDSQEDETIENYKKLLNAKSRELNKINEKRKEKMKRKQREYDIYRCNLFVSIFALLCLFIWFSFQFVTMKTH